MTSFPTVELTHEVKEVEGRMKDCHVTPSGKERSGRDNPKRRRTDSEHKEWRRGKQAQRRANKREKQIKLARLGAGDQTSHSGQAGPSNNDAHQGHRNPSQNSARTQHSLTVSSTTSTPITRDALYVIIFDEMIDVQRVIGNPDLTTVTVVTESLEAMNIVKAKLETGHNLRVDVLVPEVIFCILVPKPLHNLDGTEFVKKLQRFNEVNHGFPAGSLLFRSQKKDPMNLPSGPTTRFRVFVAITPEGISYLEGRDFTLRVPGNTVKVMRLGGSGTRNGS